MGYQLAVHVSLGVHLPILSGTFKVSNRREKYILCCLFPKIYTCISEYYFQK